MTSARLLLRRLRNTLALTGELGRWRKIAAESPRKHEPAVFYGYDQMPGRADVVFGGMVKFAMLAEHIPNAPRDFNLLYLGSSSMPRDASALVGLARRRGARFVWNQNGVG